MLDSSGALKYTYFSQPRCIILHDFIRKIKSRDLYLLKVESFFAIVGESKTDNQHSTPVLTVYISSKSQFTLSFSSCCRVFKKKQPFMTLSKNYDKC